MKGQVTNRKGANQKYPTHRLAKGKGMFVFFHLRFIKTRFSKSNLVPSLLENFLKIHEHLGDLPGGRLLFSGLLGENL